MPDLTKYYEAAIQEGPVAANEVIALAGTDRLDRDDEVVLPSAFRFENYRKNPVFMYGHASGKPSEGEFGMPIGTNLWAKPSRDGTGLVAKFAFDVEDPFAFRLCGKAKRGVLKTYSVRFTPIKFGPPTAEEIKRRPDWARAKTIYREVELLEISLVALPANPDAETLVKGAKAVDEAEAVTEPAPDPSTVVAESTEPPADPVEKTASDGAGSDDTPEGGEDDDEVEEQEPIRAGHHVKCSAPHVKGYGKCMSVHKDGMVPDVEDDIMGTKAEPACRVKMYKKMGEGWTPTEHHRGMKCKDCDRVEALKPPGREKAVAPAPEPAERRWTDTEKAAYKAAKLASLDFRSSVEKAVRTQVDTRIMGRA